jgi:hypothetical protein
MNKKPTVPAPSKLNLLRQICNFIPEFLVAKIARETKVDERARTFSPWSHVVALVYAQLTHTSRACNRRVFRPVKQRSWRGTAICL